LGTLSKEEGETPRRWVTGGSGFEPSHRCPMVTRHSPCEFYRIPFSPLSKNRQNNKVDLYRLPLSESGMYGEIPDAGTTSPRSLEGRWAGLNLSLESRRDYEAAGGCCHVPGEHSGAIYDLRRGLFRTGGAGFLPRMTRMTRMGPMGRMGGRGAGGGRAVGPHIRLCLRHEGLAHV
jgi:hypothetical protein